MIDDESSSKSYNESVVEKCLESAADADYTSVEDCYRLGGIGYVIQYNFTALHVSPLYQVLADEALVREAKNDTGFNIQCTIAPLPITRIEDTYSAAEDAFTVWFLVVLSFPFIAGAFASFVVAERESKAKHLQTVAGVEPAAYWISTYLWDVINYQIPLWITVGLMFVFDANVLTTSKNDVFTGVLAILFLYGPASAGFSYCVSFAFKSPSMCNVVLIISGFLVGMGGPMTIFILQVLGETGSSNLRDVAKIVAWCLRFMPSFCLGQGLFLAINIESVKYWEADPDISVWSKPVLLLEVICLILQAVLYLGLAILLDIWSTNPAAMSVWQSFVKVITFSWMCGTGGAGFEISVALPDDDDVITEQDRVLSGEANDDLIVMNQLTKQFDNGKVAVNQMSLGIPHGECFGLLGINGAGKVCRCLFFRSSVS
jgi:ATP-binding cassette subfamily A (ABC1) protein 3